MSDRRTQAAMLALVGAMTLWLGLTDAALAYVRGTLRPPLVASGAVLLVLAGAALRGRQPAPGGHGHDHGVPRSGWLLALPVLVLLLVAPPALGSFAAGRQAGSATAAGGDPGGVFPALPEPVGGAVPLPVSEFVTRALYDKDRTLDGARVRLLGFAAPGNDGGYLLTRWNLFCCAADGQAYQLEVRGDRVRRQPDQWLVVEGRWLPQRVYDGIAPSGARPVLLADSVTPVRPPADPYEHNLYGL
ncbi:MAG TPA: TIGR03943 family protein [Actinomycetota bacterium]|nr:TIGR03943 family protein [Actinomycetota bacterium]